MTDLPTTAVITRPILGGGDLNFNDHTNYVLAGPNVMGGTVQWDRQTVSAPWVDGDITVARRRGNVMDQITIYVTGSDQSALNSNISTLISAFTQDRFGMQISTGGANHAWDCECADYQVEWDTVHVYAKYVKVTFTIPRKPVPTAGAF
jgi:hypothetical protein